MRLSRRGSVLFQLLILFAPWWLRRVLLVRVLGFELAATSYIGRSIVESREVRLDEGSHIGNMTFVKGLSRLHLGEDARIENLNWITAFPVENLSFFSEVSGRRPGLFVHEQAAITSRHYIDCTDSITVGSFTTIAGWHSQIITHSIDLQQGFQSCAPITIGRYCFVGTRTILLPGITLGDYNVVGAGSVVSRSFPESYNLVSGVPAIVVRKFAASAAYFARRKGVVH